MTGRWRFAILAGTGAVNSQWGAGVRVIIEQLEVVGWDELEVDEILRDSNRSGGAGQLSPWKGGCRLRPFKHTRRGDWIIASVEVSALHHMKK